MKTFETPDLAIELFGLNDVLTTSGEPEEDKKGFGGVVSGKGMFGSFDQSNNGLTWVENDFAER